MAQAAPFLKRQGVVLGCFQMSFATLVFSVLPLLFSLKTGSELKAPFYMPFVLISMGALPVLWQGFRRDPRLSIPSRRLGRFLKTSAVVHAFGGLCIGTLLLSSQNIAADEPWKAWVIVLWLWAMAVFAYLVGDDQVREASQYTQK
ncbi:MAG: hypothetical protein HY291_12760 [Planctomycetes bacterium]|nr:hypothetical protein [Planctomycetota bacterium]